MVVLRDKGHTTSCVAWCSDGGQRAVTEYKCLPIMEANVSVVTLAFC